MGYIDSNFNIPILHDEYKEAHALFNMVGYCVLIT